MTLEELAARLEALGFLCDVDHFKEDGESRLIVHKLTSTPGNHIKRNVLTCDLEENGVRKTIELDGVAPMIWFRPGGIHYFVSATIPRSRGAYEKWFREPAEVYDEIIHYFFDADSPMSVEVDFVPGPGRPPGA